MKSMEQQLSLTTSGKGVLEAVIFREMCGSSKLRAAYGHASKGREDCGGRLRMSSRRVSVFDPLEGIGDDDWLV